MANNYETDYNEILYDFDINENTVWCSHSNGMLISQRFYTDGVTVHAVCDIPCYPTGLFLHLDITGPKIIHETDETYVLGSDFRLEYYPYSGRICIYGTNYYDGDISDYYTIKYVWGSVVPKTYCANGEKIFGYHDFEWKKIDKYDLKEKWYVGDFQEYSYKKRLSAVGINGTFGNQRDTTTVWIDCPKWDGTTPEIVCDNINNITITYSGYDNMLVSQQKIGLKFKRAWPGEEQNFTFDYKIQYSVSDDNMCNELQNQSSIIFVDPNLWCFTTRTVNKNQTDEDMARYPMYKAANNSGSHQAIYLLNTKDLEGTYDFLSTSGKSYIYQNKNKTYEGFTYGYMSNMPEDTKWPVNDGAVSVLSTGDDNLSYYNHTSSVGDAFLVSRYGINGTATKAIIQDSPFSKDQEDNTKWLMEGIKEETNLLYQKTGYSLYNPYLLYTNDDKHLRRDPRYSAMIDQFHLLIEDVVYRIPLNWHIQLVKKANVIGSIETDWYYEYEYNYYKYLKADSGELIIQSMADSSINEYNWKKLNDTTHYFNLLPRSWKYELKTNIQWESPEITWKLPTLKIIFEDKILAIDDHPLYATSPFNIEHHNLNETYLIGKTQKSEKLVKQSNASISSAQHYFIEEPDNYFFWFYIGLGIQKPGYRLRLFQSINSDPYQNLDSDQYLAQIEIFDNELSYSNIGTITRTIETNETFTSSLTQKIIPANYWGGAPFNGIPLISYWSNIESTELGKWDSQSYFFNLNSIHIYERRSRGLDAFAQFFDYDQYPEASTFLYAWPESD